MKKRIIYAYIVCIHLLLGVVLLKSYFFQCAEHKQGSSQAATTQPEITQHFKRMLRYHARMDGNVPDGAVVFIGDSITQGLCVSAVAPSSVNYGIGSDTTVGVLQRLPAYKSINRASAVVIAIGINDMRLRSNEDILRNYSAMVEQIPKDMPVIFSAVLPLDQEIRDYWQGMNDRIKALNAELEGLTEKSENLFFVDAGAILVDDQGNLADEYHDGDGVHLNPKGNAIWIQHLQKAIEKAQQ